LNKLWENIIKGGSLAAVVIFIGYILSFSYYVGFLSYYSISPLLISISLTLIFNFVFRCFTQSTILMLMIVGLLSCIPVPKNKYWYAPVRDSLFIAVLYIVLYNAIADPKLINISTLVLIGSLSIIWVERIFVPLVKFRNTKGLTNKFSKIYLLKNSKMKVDESSNKFSRFIPRHLGVSLLVVMILSIFSYLAYSYGYRDAVNKTRYYSSNDYLLIINDNEKAIMGKYDYVSNKFLPSIRVIPISNLGQLDLLSIR